jgi:hypothetical protein
MDRMAPTGLTDPAEGHSPACPAGYGVPVNLSPGFSFGLMMQSSDVIE